MIRDSVEYPTGFDWPKGASTQTHPFDVDSALKRALTPLAVVEAPSASLAAANSAFAAMLRVDSSRLTALDMFSFIVDEERPVMEAVLAGVASGRTDSYQGRSRWRRGDGEAFDVLTSMQPLESDGPPTRALLAAVPADQTAHRLWAPVPAGAPSPIILGVVDHAWTWREISADATRFLGWDRDGIRGEEIRTAIHPEDVPPLELALSRASADGRSVTAPVRLRDAEGGWHPVRVSLSPLSDDPPCWVVAAMPIDDEREREGAAQRASRLEGHLWRVALEIEASGIGGSTAGALRVAGPELTGLSDRQSEIVRRVLRGERAPAIARDLFISPSTVRNHLSTIYRRLGVHSQSELLARLLPVD